MKIAIRVLALFLGFQSYLSASATEIPNLPNHLTCLDTNHEALPYLNDEVLEWKRNTPDQTLKRALVEGVVAQIYPSKTGHAHFAINIDQQAGGDLEVIYNDSFGKLPAIKVGMKIVACGDYITVGPRAKLPSPMGAIIHWVHYNPGDRDGGKHKHGFLIIDGKPFGTAPKL
jgi:hypothetical protein